MERKFTSVFKIAVIKGFMKKFVLIVYTLIFFSRIGFSQTNTRMHFQFREDVIITVDWPVDFSSHKQTQLVLYALPNGNSIEQTMGKKMQEGDDWHFDIQHIAAQTNFIRDKIKSENIVVVYVENNYKSWPSYKTKHENYHELITALIDTIPKLLLLKKYYYHLNGHSGGGALILAYLQSQERLPSIIHRISFLDSDYNYDSTYTNKFVQWLKRSSSNYLSVFAYNDSVVVYNGKPLVSPHGGTWYRSKWMMKELSQSFNFEQKRNDSVIQYSANHNRVNFFLIDNPNGKIFHTVQVERNGFIHSVLVGTKFENDGYVYWGSKVYGNYIR